MEILLMIQSANILDIRDHKPALLNSRFFHAHTQAFHHEPHACHLKQYKKLFSPLVLLLDKKIQQIKIVSHAILFLFISTKRAIDHNVN